MLPALSHTPIKVPESYTLNSTWNRMRPIFCFEDGSECFSSCVVVVSVDQSLLSKMHLSTVPQRHWGGSWILSPPFSSILHHTEGSPPTFLWALKFQTLPKCSTLKKPRPLTQTNSVALHFREETADTGWTLGNSTGRMTGIPDWLFQSNLFHMPFWLYSA